MDLGTEVEERLAQLDDTAWDALVCRVRPPATPPGDGGRAEAERRFGKGSR